MVDKNPGNNVILLKELQLMYADLLRVSWLVRMQNHPPVIRFDRPSQTLPVSLTGEACALHCAHCNGVYLRRMHTLQQADASQAASLLVSGGCTPDGRVPVSASQLEHIRQLKARGLRLNWHLGFIEETELRTIAPLVDMLSFDVVGDSATAREVYGLDVTLSDYMRTFDLIRSYAPTVAHITIGLRGGRLSGELDALEMLAERGVNDLVLLVLIPTPGTAYANCPPPALEDVLRVFCAARQRLPRAQLYLGCMRPRGEYRQACDALAVRAGLNVIVNPQHATVVLAEELGLLVRYGVECCTLN